MGKAGRIACIFTPWALTVASFVCLVLIELSGWPGTALGEYYFFQANFTNLSVRDASIFDNNTELELALKDAQDAHLLADVYQIHLWNYCSSNSSDGKPDYCSAKHAEFYFNIMDVWQLNSTSVSGTGTSSGNNAVASAIASAKNNTEELENKLLGKSAKDALDAYRDVSKWMFIAYEISFWATLATIVCSIFAIFSRIGSFFTWLFSIVSTFFTVAAVLTSTILFSVLVGALKSLLHQYGIQVSLGTHALVLTWLAVLFSCGATFFWLFSVCCCSGRSNPHHRSNKGGLWNAEPKGQGYGDYGRGRGLRVEKTGGNYERVGSPFLAGGEYGDRVPLRSFPQSGGHQRAHSASAYEPFRHA